MCIDGEKEFHIPIHILYWFINRHFYKTMKSSCLNKKKKILMSKIISVGIICFTLSVNILRCTTGIWRNVNNMDTQQHIIYF